MARVTGRRRRGTIKSGVCTSCGWSGPRIVPTLEQRLVAPMREATS